MDRNLQDYFAAGVRLVWYIHHTPRREVWVYKDAVEYSVLREGDSLDGDEVMPGFQLALSELFAKPEAPAGR